LICYAAPVVTAASITEWGLGLASQYDLELRPGNEGEVGPTRGFSLHVRGLEHGRIFQYDPEGKPQRLITWLPDIAPALEEVAALMADREKGFLPAPADTPYLTLRWNGTERRYLNQVMQIIIVKTKQLAVPEMPELP